MSIITSQQFETLLQLAGAWAAEQERVILQSGVPLTEVQLADARQVGVIHPERVRLLRVVQIPRPSRNVNVALSAAGGEQMAQIGDGQMGRDAFSSPD